MRFFSAIWANYQPHAGVFGVIALAPLVVAVIGRTVFGPPAALANDRPGRRVTSAGRDRRNTAIATLCIVAAAAAYVYVMAAGDDLVGIDYAQLTAHRFVDVPILPESGRFFPLAFQEFNLLDLIGRTATVYYTFAALELALMLVLIYRLLACHRLAERRQSPWPALGALAAAQYALYLKETSFLLIGGFAATRLFILWLHERTSAAREGPHGPKFFATHWLDFGLVTLCGTYVVLYVSVILPHVAVPYGSHGGMLATATAYVARDPLLVLLGIAVVARVAKALAGTASLDPFWDAAAIGALALLLAYVKLGMYRDYYAAPADLLGVMYLARAAPTFLPNRRPVAATACLVAFAAIVVNGGVVAKRLFDRKVYVAETRALVADLFARVSHERLTTLFFPQYGAFQIMEFGAYLQYRGMAVKGAAERAEVVFKTPHRFPDDRCLPSQAIRCEFAAKPGAGDLVVLLPGREPPPALAGAVVVSRPVSEPAPRSFIYELLARVAADGDDPPRTAGAVLAADADTIR